MMLDKMQISVIFLFEFIVCHKTSEAMCNINNAFDPGTANKCTVPWWFKKFFKGNESLEDEESNGKPLEVVNDQLRGSLKLILLEPQEKLLRNSRLNILWLLGF